MRHLRPHPFVWVDRKMREWWPFLVSVAAVCLIATMSFVTYTVVDERAYFEAEQERDRRQDAQVAQLLELQRRSEAGRDERLEQALADVEALLASQFAEHDFNVATKLNDLLAQIAALLGRPAGVAVDPVVAIDGDGSPTAPPQREPRERAQPTTTTQPPSTTTTTSPGRSDLCDRMPTTPICRRPR